MIPAYFQNTPTKGGILAGLFSYIMWKMPIHTPKSFTFPPTLFPNQIE